MLRSSSWICAVSVLVLGCGPTSQSNSGDGGSGNGDGGSADDLIQLVIAPGDTIIELDINSPGTQAYTVTGTYRDGTTTDLSDSVTWSTDNPAVGTFSGTTLEIPSFQAAAVETAVITAAFEDRTTRAQVTVVAYRQSGPTQDFFFVLPYEDPTGPKKKPLDFSTDIPSLDVFLLMDTTGSLAEEIANLQSTLSTELIPGVTAAVADSHFGVGTFQDFPVNPYGSTNGASDCPGALAQPDQPFRLFQAITDNATLVAGGVDDLSTPGGAPIGCGNDWPESHIEGLYQVATGEGLNAPGLTSVAPNSSGIGGVGFRADTMPVVVSITDAMSHAKGETVSCVDGVVSSGYNAAVEAVAHSRAEAKSALDSICARVVGIAPILDGSPPPACTGQPDLEDFATHTGARVPPEAWDVPARPPGCASGQCCTDMNGTGRAPDGDGLCPLVFRADSAGAGLGGHIVTGINMLTRYAPFDVTTEKLGGTTSDAGDILPVGTTTADFLLSIVPAGFQLPPAPPVLPTPTFDTMAFQGVTPGTTVSFDVTARNNFVPEISVAQIFRATIRVLAGGCTPLDEREVIILVPPAPIVLE